MFRYLILILFSSNGPLGVPIRGKESRTGRMLVLVVGGQFFDVVGRKIQGWQHQPSLGHKETL